MKLADKFLLALLLFALFVEPGFHSSSQATAQSDSFRIRADVELVTVEVTALDSQGKPIRNLKKEDFRLYEDGKKQEIVSVDEVSGDSGISSLGVVPMNEERLPRGKTVFIIFDNNSIERGFFQQSRISAESFVRKHMKPHDLFAVAVYGSSMKILQSFTGDRVLVLSAIARSADYARESIILGSAYLEELFRSFENINYSMAPLRGQKTVLYYGKSVHYVISPSALLKARYSAAMKSAMKSGVAYYPVDPAGGAPEPTGNLDTAVNEASKILPPNPRALPSSGQPDESSASRSSMQPMAPVIQPIPPPINSSNWSLSENSRSMTSATGLPTSLSMTVGGYSIFDKNNIDGELDKLGGQLSHYYILGFQSSNPKRDGAYRKLQVKTRAKGVIMKYQGGYLDRRPIDALASSKQEKALMTALASPVAAGQSPIICLPFSFYDSPEFAKVFLEARISLEKVNFRSKGDELSADINIMGAAYSEDGSLAARFSQNLPISVEKNREAEFRKLPYAYRYYFKLRPGKYRLKLAASDESTNLGSTERAFEIPTFPKDGLAGSSIVLAEKVSPLPELIKNIRIQLLDEDNPLIYSGMQIEPRAENGFPVGSTAQILFRLYNLSAASDQWELIAKPRLLNEKGEYFALAPVPLKNLIVPAGNQQGVVLFNLPFQGVSPGKYTLMIEVADAVSAATATLQTDVELR
jgi:VWFA-related protein